MSRELAAQKIHILSMFMPVDKHACVDAVTDMIAATPENAESREKLLHGIPLMMVIIVVALRRVDKHEEARRVEEIIEMLGGMQTQ